MIRAELIDRLRLVRTAGVGPITYRRLLDRFANAAEAIEALPALARAGGRSSPLRIASRAAAERELDGLDAIGARLLTLGETDYPPLLAQVDPAPPALTVLGEVTALTGRAVGIVGARNASTNGRRIAETLGAELAAAGVVVVSGMARGIDAAAHRGALRTGRTVAAIAGGIDTVYPPEHAALQQEVAEGGAVVAEAPLGTAPMARHFPRRNRVIAGLSQGVVVIEAAVRSGSLITARMTAEMKRDLFAVPGSPLDARCQGSNDLLRRGARVVMEADDVLANLPTSPGPLRALGMAEAASARLAPPVGTEAARRLVLENLGADPAEVDDLVRRCHVSAPIVIGALLELELGGRVELLPGNRACRIAP